MKRNRSSSIDFGNYYEKQDSVNFKNFGAISKRIKIKFSSLLELVITYFNKNYE